ncbi:MAG: hypothetical protein GY929_13005 [Actinomycetia bacterium]|nr:hypothetical protein [Actinomycetes bacterium]
MSSPTQPTFTVAAGPYRAAVSLPPQLEAAARSTLRDLIVDTDDEVPYQATVEPDGPGSFSLSADGRLFHQGVAAEKVPDYLIRMLLLAELDANPGVLHLHAGLVALEGQGVTIAGLSGAGKTTLVTHLVRSGFDYGSEERVAIDPDQLTASTFPKPVSLVPGSFALFPELDPSVTGCGQATAMEWQVPGSTIGAGGTVSHAAVDLVVQVNYERGAAARLEPMHPATAAAVLLADSPDASRFGDRSLVVAAQFCAQARCVRLVYSQLVDADRLVREALTSDNPDPPADVAIVAARAGTALAGPPSPDERVSWLLPRGAVLVDGRILAPTDDGSRLVELDDQASAWLMLLDGSQTIAELIQSVADEVGVSRAEIAAGADPLIARLVATGVLAAEI